MHPNTRDEFGRGCNTYLAGGGASLAAVQLQPQQRAHTTLALSLAVGRDRLGEQGECVLNTEMAAGQIQLFAILLVAALEFGDAVKHLPPYISSCSRTDPKLNECILKNARNAIPKMINGEPKYRVPNLNPLVIPELRLRQGTEAVGLKLAWKDAALHGLPSADLQSCEASVTKRHLKLNFFVPKMSITGTYTASGRVLLLPVTGTGPSNITVHNMKASYDISWNLVKRSNGKEYLDLIDPKITLHDIGFMSLKFDNLFNGDRLLGGNLNTFFNENWKDLAKEFGPGVADAIGEVFQLVFKNVCDIVPYDLVFKP
ncbi:hypothetical protein FOCC_FOCC000001 [Frankliniella occidentalis]|nr:hypothetical protein FOCC_FOCC000001 [Frankliniella occidentalis]